MVGHCFFHGVTPIQPIGMNVDLSSGISIYEFRSSFGSLHPRLSPTDNNPNNFILKAITEWLAAKAEHEFN
jgi:hypothetical protein